MFIAVIHLIHESHLDLSVRTIEQVNIAFNNGAGGVFLIPAEYGITVDDTITCYHAVRKLYPDAFIGVNFLSSPNVSAEQLPLTANALWIDHGLGSSDQSERLLSIKGILNSRGWNGKIYGGFMFKGNNRIFPADEIMDRYVELLPQCMDVAVTSGPCTGVAADEEFFTKVKGYAHRANIPLGMASGVNEVNIHHFLPHVQDFIIGTGIEETSLDPATIQFYQEAGLSCPVNVGHLDPVKVARLAKIINDAQMK